MPTSDPSRGADAIASRPAVSTLTIDLDAVAENYHALASRAAPATCAAVVKADAYGLGIETVARRLWREECRTFFVASLDEAVALRAFLAEAEIVALNGLMPGEAAFYRAHRILPTLNDLSQIESWRRHWLETRPLPAAVHLDTGMSRLGLPPNEQRILLQGPERLDGFECRYLLSHLACADSPDHPLNTRQHDLFAEARGHLPGVTASLAASSGIFLGPEWHFDMVRAGVALYGGAPNPTAPNPMATTVRLDAVVLQLRDVDSPESVGYGATHQFRSKTRVATIAAGYADGYLRSLGGHGAAYWGETALPLIGRVSMDLITLDATAAIGLKVGDTVELIGPNRDINDLARDAGTIPYEMLTSLGRRYRRRYLGQAG